MVTVKTTEESGNNNQIAPFILNILLNLFLSHTTDTFSLCN